MKASVIDLGYNSLKMVSYEARPDKTFRAYDQRGELTRLGEGLNETGFLSRAAIDRTIRQLKLFGEANKLEGVELVLAIATSPLREAGNGNEFLEDAARETGLHFKVLTGREEALFSYIGAARSTKLPHVLFFDLGGGSLELTYVRDNRVRKILSLPIGALRMTELFRPDGSHFEKKAYNGMRRRILDLLPTREELDLRGAGGEGRGGVDAPVLLGVGGTIRALARYEQWTSEYPLSKLHNYKMPRTSVMAIHKLLRKMSPQKIAAIDAFGKDRAQSITAGSLIVGLLMGRLAFDEVTVSTHGLRDGMLFEYLRDPKGYHVGEFDESRANASLSGSTRNPGAGAADLNRALEAHGIITGRERTILDEANEGFLQMYLSTTGENLFYSVINEDSALAHGDQVALALALVRAKAAKTANWFYSRYKSVLIDKNKQSIVALSAFIQLGVILELTGSKAKLRVGAGELRFEILASRPDFPTLLLGQVVKDLEAASGRAVKTTIHKHLGGVRA